MNYNKREWQLFEVSLLDKVVAICEKYSIRYFLNSGTLLGAIRHKGFIPWDDDIDISMPIRDYNRFCKIAPLELKKVDCFLQTYKTDPKSKNLWAMVRANGTTSMPIKDYKWDIHWGIHIDIFPLIGLYENNLLRKIQKKLFGFNATLLESDYIKSHNCNLGYKIPKKIKVLYKIPRRIRHLIVSLNNIYINKDFDKSKLGTLIWWKFDGNYPSNIFKDYILVEFEGKKYKASTNADIELSMLYGDYMILPPIEERMGHELLEGDVIRDLSKDYKLYQNELN